MELFGQKIKSFLIFSEKKVLSFPEMELSSPKIKKYFILLEIELFIISSYISVGNFSAAALKFVLKKISYTFS